MFADELDCFLAVHVSLSVNLEMTAIVLGTAEGGTFDTCHSHLGGGHTLPTVSHNLIMLGLCQWLVANRFVSC